MTTTAGKVCEMFKLLRQGPMNRPEIERELGWAGNTVYKWCSEMAAQGLLVEHLSESGKRRGPRSIVYELSPEWGGRAKEQRK